MKIASMRRSVRRSVAVGLAAAALVGGLSAGRANAFQITDHEVQNVGYTEATVWAKSTDWVNATLSVYSHPIDLGQPQNGWGVPDAYDNATPGTAVWAHVSGLKNNTTYYYQVAAVNSISETRSAEKAATPRLPRYVALVPARVLDTRFGNGAPVAPVGAGGVLNLQVTGRGGPSNVPSTASAVVLNVTVVNPTDSSYVTVWPTGGSQPPLASNLNFVAGEVIANLVVVKVGAGGQVSLYNNTGSTDLIADVVGYFG